MLKRISLVVAFATLGCALNAQQRLGDLVAQAGVEWLLGDWQAVTDSGDVVQLGFKADLDQHIGFVHHKDARTETKGIILVDPNSSEPKFYAGNNQGGVGTGTWTAEYGKAILKYRVTTPDWQTYRMGLTFRRIDADTIEVALSELSASDQIVGEPRGIIQFKRKK